MKKLILPVLAVALAAGVAAPAFAEDAPPKGDHPKGDRPHLTPEEAFKKRDTNGDGKLSLEEFKASPRFDTDEKKAKATEYFKKLDKDGDGFLTLEEFKAGGPPPHHKDGDKPAEKK